MYDSISEVAAVWRYFRNAIICDYYLLLQRVDETYRGSGKLYNSHHQHVRPSVRLSVCPVFYQNYTNCYRAHR